MPTLRNGKRAASASVSSAAPRQKAVKTEQHSSASSKTKKSPIDRSASLSEHVPRADSPQNSIPPASQELNGRTKGTQSEEKNQDLSPSTPPPSTPTHRNEKTPGREGPILDNHDRECKPHIERFKGPKSKRVRKTPAEMEKEHTKFILDHPAHTFHQEYLCAKKGPKGSPTYDRSGFQLDYQSCQGLLDFKPMGRRAAVNAAGRHHQTVVTQCPSNLPYVSRMRP